MPPDQLTLDRFPTPIGDALLVTDDSGRLRAFDWSNYEARMHKLMRRQYGTTIALESGRAPKAILRALEAYFSGDITAIDSIPVETSGTPFQRGVWTTLREIPAGKTWTYSQMAVRIGSPKAVRAVGLANGSNPVGLVLPCHRVIGADGSLTGYGGGLDRKRWLLEHEGVLCPTLCATASGSATK